MKHEYQALFDEFSPTGIWRLCSLSILPKHIKAYKENRLTDTEIKEEIEQTMQKFLDRRKQKRAEMLEQAWQDLWTRV